MNVVWLRSEDEQSWGGSTLDAHTFKRREAVKAAARARRALWQTGMVTPRRDNRGKFVALPRLNEGDVFTTSSGQKAYAGSIRNMTSAVIRESSQQTMISLPFVSILFGAGH